MKKTTYRNRQYAYGPGYGPGAGYGYGRGPARGYGRGRRWASPNCDWYPDRPRGWWAMPGYSSQFPDPTITPPPEGAIYDTFGRPSNPDALDYEISMIENTIKDLQKEIVKLKSVKKSQA